VNTAAGTDNTAANMTDVYDYVETS